MRTLTIRLSDGMGKAKEREGKERHNKETRQGKAQQGRERLKKI